VSPKNKTSHSTLMTEDKSVALWPDNVASCTCATENDPMGILHVRLSWVLIAQLGRFRHRRAGARECHRHQRRGDDKAERFDQLTGSGSHRGASTQLMTTDGALLFAVFLPSTLPPVIAFPCTFTTWALSRKKFLEIDIILSHRRTARLRLGASAYSLRIVELSTTLRWRGRTRAWGEIWIRRWQGVGESKSRAKGAIQPGLRGGRIQRLAWVAPRPSPCVGRCLNRLSSGGCFR
jgi:hypothetical protein